MTSAVIDVPGKLATVNATRYGHWTSRAQITREWRYTAQMVARHAKVGRMDCVVITVTPHQFRGRLADACAHNVCVKGAIDGLVDAGVLPDDSPTHVVAVQQERPVRARRARDECLRIEIREVADPEMKEL